MDRGVQKVTLKMINEDIAKHKLQVADQCDAASKSGHSGWAHRHLSLYNTINACDGLVVKLRKHELSKSSADGRAWPAKTKSLIALTKLATGPAELAFLMYTLLQEIEQNKDFGYTALEHRGKVIVWRLRFIKKVRGQYFLETDEPHAAEINAVVQDKAWLSAVAFEAKFGPGTDQTLIHELPPKASSLISLMRDVYLGKSDSVIGEVHRDRKTMGFEHTLRATPIVQLLAPIEIL